MMALPKVQQSLDLLNNIQQALNVKDLTALLPMTESYSHAVRQLDHIDDKALMAQLLAAHEGIETSLYQLQQEVQTYIEQVTQDKINHAYQAV